MRSKLNAHNGRETLNGLARMLLRPHSRVNYVFNTVIVVLPIYRKTTGERFVCFLDQHAGNNEFVGQFQVN